MKILLTKSEYRTLFDMIYMAEWMLTAFEAKPGPLKAKYHHLAQKIYSHAKEMGWESLVESSTAENEYFPTLEYEDKSGVHDLIDEFEADSFWEQLIERMTERDVYARAGTTPAQPLSHDAYSAIAEPIEKEYAREFSEHGVDNVIVTTPAAGVR